MKQEEKSYFWYNERVNIKKQKLVLLDTHAIIHRAYHALPEFSNSKGEPTGAIYGLTTMIFKIITDLKPDYIVACYDLPKKTFRHIAYDDYKKGRAKADDELVAQIIKSKELFKAFNIPTYEKEGFEADDLLGSIVEMSKQKLSSGELEIIIASGDMDTLQLVEGDHVLVYTLKKGLNDTILYNEKKVIERFSFLPVSLPDYKGLRGDPSDNIIGIKGIGEKTATILVSKYGTIEKMYEDIHTNKDKVLKLGITERIFNLLKDGEDEAIFSKTLATIRRDAPIDFKIPSDTWRNSVDSPAVLSFFRQMEFKSLQKRFEDIMEDKNSPTIKKTVSFDKFKMKKAQIAFWLLNSDYTNPTEEDILNYKDSKSFDEAYSLLENDIKEADLSYVYENIEIPIIGIVEEMQDRGITLDKKYLEEISKEYHKNLSVLEEDIWREAGREFNINSPKQLSEVLFEDLGISTKGMKKTTGHAQSTRESELIKIKELHPIVSIILEYRELQKLLSTYIDNFPALIKSDGKIHAKFLQNGTTTGRFSSSEPNLQNIPTRSDKGRKIRNAFVSSSGYTFASFDYSQIELRIAALMSGDKFFIKAFREGKDIHTAVAMKVFHVPEEEVTLLMRRRAKIINFGILYGMGVNALRENLGTDRREAQEFHDEYFKEFPTIGSYLDSIKEFAEKNGYTKTLFGRKRYFKAIKSPIPYMRAMALRMATNAPIQGTATADIIKIGMKKVDDVLIKENLKNDCHLVLQIHDELVYEIKDSVLNKAKKLITEALENVIPEEFIKDMESVPLIISASSSKRWGDMK